MEALLTMAQKRQCTACGQALADGDPDGLCNRCFLDAGLAVPPAAAAQPDATQELEGLLPRYEILADEGGGLYRARVREGGAIVALAIVRAPVAEFTTRAASLAKLDHPALARVVDHGEAGGVRYLATEYVEGRELHEVRLQPREALRVIEQICAALGHAHDHGVHLAPVRAESIRVVADGSARIARPELGTAPIDLAGVSALLHAALGGGAPAPPAKPEPPAVAPPAAMRRSPQPAEESNGALLAIVIAGAVGLIASFLPWFSVKRRDSDFAGWANGWETMIGDTGIPMWPTLVVGIAIALAAAARRAGRLDVPWGVLLGGAGACNVATLCWVIFALSADAPPGFDFSVNVGGILAWFAFVAMTVAAIGMRPAPAPVVRRSVARTDTPKRRRTKRRRS